MKGAIFFSSKYGSTAEYANWISKATDLPGFDVKRDRADPSQYDFLILGSPIIYYKLFMRKWIKRNWSAIQDKPMILFTVSGAPAGPKLDKWFENSLPSHMVAQLEYVALQGRQRPWELTLWDRQMLKFAARFNKDPQAKKDELEGFDYMDESSIEPILQWVETIQSTEISHS